MINTVDSFLGGRVKAIQPSEGYRAGIDPIFLAAALQPKPNHKVLDVGAGVGVAAMALAVRYPDIKVYGLELQQKLVSLALENISENQLDGRVEMIEGNLLSPPEVLKTELFDHVMTNPPFYEFNRSKLSPIPSKAKANTETVDLEEWIKACLKLLKPKGEFTIIHRIERLSDILYHLNDQVGNIVVYPLWPDENKPARRVLIQGRKNVRGELRLSQGINLHGGTEKYTPEAEAILRHARAIEL